MRHFEDWRFFSRYNRQYNCERVYSRKGYNFAKPSVLGKIIPSLLQRHSPIGYAARIMSHYRLRALPIIQKSHDRNIKRERRIIGQITARSIVRAIYESGVDEVDKKTDTSISSNFIPTSKDITAKLKHQI